MKQIKRVLHDITSICKIGTTLLLYILYVNGMFSFSAELRKMLWSKWTPGMIPGSIAGDPRSPQTKCPTIGGRASGGFLQYVQLLNPRNSMSITNTKGLLNMPGQNNCFLNSAVQVIQKVFWI